MQSSFFSQDKILQTFPQSKYDIKFSTDIRSCETSYCNLCLAVSIQQSLIYTVQDSVFFFFSETDKPEALRGCTVSQGVEEASTAWKWDSGIASGIYQTTFEKFNSQ